MSARQSSARSEAVHVALLRGINVGGKNMLPMAALAELFAAAGCEAVRTYIQSGNVVFRAAPALATRLPGEIARRIERRFGFAVPVVLRTGDELARVAQANPFLRAKPAPEEASLHVAFLADAPAARAVAALDPRRSPPDEFAVVGREIYLRLPNGMARTRLSNAWFDAQLETTSTVRNWRTLLTLVAMTGEDAAEPKRAASARPARARARKASAARPRRRPSAR